MIISIIAGVIGVPLALFGAYVGIRQVLQWRKEAREKERDREEVKNRLEELRHDIRGIALYPDGLAEMPERRRLALLRHGLKSMRDFKYSEAIGFFRECLGVGATQSQNIALLVIIGNCFLSTSELEEAEGHYREAEVAARESNDKEGLSTILGNMGIVYGIKGELDKALEHFQQALEIDREIGHREGEASALGNMGNVYGIKGELDKALEHHQQALEIDREIGHRKGEASDVGNMGIVYRIKGELDKALEHFQQALEIDREIGHREGEASALGNMGNVYRIKGELDKALEHHQQALEIDREIGHREGEASDLGNMGNVYQIKGELDKALEQYQQALEIFEEIGAEQSVVKVRKSIIVLRRGSPERRRPQKS